jgi:hypothetical protein
MFFSLPVVARGSHNVTMNTYFSGVLVLPQMRILGSESAVTTAEGVPVALLKSRTGRSCFEILDPAGGGLLATGAQASIWGTKYELMGPQSQFLLQVKFSGWRGPTGPGTVTLADGRTLTTKGTMSGRDFSISDGAGTPVGKLHTTSRVFTLKRSGLELELTAAVLTAVQAIGLAEFLRTAVEAATAAAA